MTGFAHKFAGDSVSLPLWLRLALTAPFAAVSALLAVALFLAAAQGSPGGALAVFLLGGVLTLGIPLMRAVWRPSASWRHHEQRKASVERRVRDVVNSDHGSDRV